MISSGGQYYENESSDDWESDDINIRFSIKDWIIFCSLLKTSKLITATGTELCFHPIFQEKNFVSLYFEEKPCNVCFMNKYGNTKIIRKDEEDISFD